MESKPSSTPMQRCFHVSERSQNNAPKKQSKTCNCGDMWSGGEIGEAPHGDSRLEAVIDFTINSHELKRQNKGGDDGAFLRS